MVLVTATAARGKLEISKFEGLTRMAHLRTRMVKQLEPSSGLRFYCSIGKLIFVISVEKDVVRWLGRLVGANARSLRRLARC